MLKSQKSKKSSYGVLKSLSKSPSPIRSPSPLKNSIMTVKLDPVIPQAGKAKVDIKSSRSKVIIKKSSSIVTNKSQSSLMSATLKESSGEGKLKNGFHGDAKHNFRFVPP